MPSRSIFLLCTLLTSTAAFSISPVPTTATTALRAADTNEFDEEPQALTSRRGVIQGLASAGLFVVSSPFAALADGEKVPMLSTEEFFTIVRDSARSIQRVEFSGVKSETVRVRLIDGTVFGLNDVVESPTDPRSPLKVQAACREAKIPFKNLQMEAILATAPKKTKMYTNQRVQDAAAKEKERLERLARDEEERLAQLFKMEEEEAKRAAAAGSSS